MKLGVNKSDTAGILSTNLNPRIKGNYMSKNRVFQHFFRHTTVNFFDLNDFLHDDIGQHCATSGLGVRFQKK